MRKAKISIIMGIYNCEKYLKDSIDSLLSQTYDDWNLIMCDDGSNDNTYFIAKDYANKYPNKILLLKNDKNKGLNFTLNRCLEYANCEYIARQDGDDISSPERFRIQNDFLDANSEYAFVSSNAFLFDENGIWGKTNYKEKPNKIDFVTISPFIHAAAIIRKNILSELEGYTVSKKMLRVEDYHLWFKIYSKGYLGYNLPDDLYYIRDDRKATKRRNFKNRINEVRLKILGFKMLGIPYKYYIYAIRPIAVWLLPKKIYDNLHRSKFKTNK